MGLLKLSYIVTITTFVWILLTTVLPNTVPDHFNYDASLKDKDGYLSTAYYNFLNTPSIIDHKLINSHILLFTAHPDDESMFFTPTITELTKENYNNSIHLICLSNGGFDGLGDIRERELFKAGKLLDIDSVKVLDYVDDINKYWETSDVVKTIDNEIQIVKNKYNLEDENIILLTFDQTGISSHPNHKSIYLAVKEYTKQMKVFRAYSLKSWNILVKYSGMLFTNYEITLKWLNECEYFKHILDNMPFNTSKFNSDTIDNSSLTIYSDLHSLFLNYSTMTWVHYSQIVWFRWIWIFSSKYMNSNELIAIN